MPPLLHPLPQRKANRLPAFDYASCGAYFVTICVSPRRNIFWQMKEEGKTDALTHVGADIIRPFADIIRPFVPPPLTKAGEIVRRAIDSIADHYPQVSVACSCIMPDHVHLMLVFAADDCGRMISAPTLSTVIGSMKRYVSRQLGRSIWQKSFYDRVIRPKRDSMPPVATSREILRNGGRITWKVSYPSMTSSEV